MVKKSNTPNTKGLAMAQPKAEFSVLEPAAHTELYFTMRLPPFDLDSKEHLSLVPKGISSFFTVKVSYTTTKKKSEHSTH